MEIAITCFRRASGGVLTETFSWTPRLRQTAEPRYAASAVVRLVCAAMAAHRKGLRLLSVDDAPFSRVYSYEEPSWDPGIPAQESAVVTMRPLRGHKTCDSCAYDKGPTCWLLGRRRWPRDSRCVHWAEDLARAVEGARIHVLR